MDLPEPNPFADREDRTVARLANEYATVWLELDEGGGNGPRLRVMSVRDEREVALDPVALSLLCELDQNLLGLLADIARDPAAREQFADWFATRHDALVVPEGLTGPVDPDV